MNGLEPSTFCMARTRREATGTDWRRHSWPLCGGSVHPSDSNRQQPTLNLTENLTALPGHAPNSL